MATLLLATVAVLLARPVATVPFLIPKGYNEGWNAFQALRAMGSGPLYPDSTALVANNYPPLSFYIVGSLGSLIGDNIIAGRLIALTAFVVVAILVGVIARNLCGSRYAGMVASLLFMGYPAALHASFLGMDDPQWLAQALMTMALALVLARAGGASRSWILPVVLLSTASGLTKHSVIPLPLALTIWLAFHDRRGLQAWLGWSFLALAAALGVIYGIYGPEFFQNVVGFHRIYSAHDIAPKLARLAVPLLPLLGALVAFVFLEPASRSKQLLLTYVVVATGWGVYALGGAGVQLNVIYDAMIGLAIMAGVVVQRVGERLRYAGVACVVEAALAVVLAIPMLNAAPRQLLALPAMLPALRDYEKRVASDVKYVAGVRGPAACESLALCYWAGKPFEFDMFVVGQKLETGVLRVERFNELIEQHYFKSFEMTGVGARERLPQSSIDWIRQHYETARSGVVGEVLLPRTTTSERK